MDHHSNSKTTIDNSLQYQAYTDLDHPTVYYQTAPFLNKKMEINYYQPMEKLPQLAKTTLKSALNKDNKL